MQEIFHQLDRIRRQARLLVFGLTAVTAFTPAFHSAAWGAEKLTPLDVVTSGLKQTTDRLTGSWNYALYEKGRRAGSFRIEIRAAGTAEEPVYDVEMATNYTSGPEANQSVSIRGEMTPDLQLVSGERNERRYNQDGTVKYDQVDGISLDGDHILVRSAIGNEKSEARIPKPHRLYFGVATLFAAARMIDLKDSASAWSFDVLSPETLRVQSLILRVVRKSMPLEDRGRAAISVSDVTRSGPLLEMVVDPDGTVARFGPAGGSVVFRRIEEKKKDR